MRHCGLTQEYLINRISYDPITGHFTWKSRDVFCRADKVWNTKYVGKVAGCPDSKGRIQIKIDGIAYAASRLAWLYVHGIWSQFEIDHENRIRNDNRLDNLREATSSQNSANMKTPVTNTSGFRGVRWQDTGWRAQISVRGKKYHLGSFSCQTAAALAYDKKAQESHGEFAMLNFPRRIAS